MSQQQENVIYMGAGGAPYCRIESTGVVPGVSRFGGHGVAIQRLRPDGVPIGPPLLFSDAGAMQLERLLKQARAGAFRLVEVADD